MFPYVKFAIITRMHAHCLPGLLFPSKTWERGYSITYILSLLSITHMIKPPGLLLPLPIPCTSFKKSYIISYCKGEASEDIISK